MDALYARAMRLIENYGTDNMVDVYQACADEGAFLGDSTVDFLGTEGGCVLVYFDRTMDDYNHLDAFTEDDVEQFLDRVEDYFKYDNE